jgi:S-adenosylmethionine:tRNA ribosyltransferase-isomerase
VGLSASDFDYELPAELIAAEPAAARDQSRLLVVSPQGPAEDAASQATTLHVGPKALSASCDLWHERFANLPELVSRHVGERTLIVLNDSKVLAARLHGHKRGPDGERGGSVEFLLTEPVFSTEDQGSPRARWRALYRCSKPLRKGQIVRLHKRDAADVPPHDVHVEQAEGGNAIVDLGPLSDGEFSALLARLGELPLPPYIENARVRDGGPRSRDEDRIRYQTVFARREGSVAAPTAGLHFTEELLGRLRAAGHEIAHVTLHVGPGTFLPLRSERIEQHVMHSERYQISAATAEAIQTAKAQGRKVLAIGTTVVRTLESAARASDEKTGAISPCNLATTQIFIYPPFRFAVVDALLTNFHLPRSTLLMLVAAFAGRRRILAAYQEAVAQRYRFYSFGDAMLIPRVQGHVEPPRPVAPAAR